MPSKQQVAQDKVWIVAHDMGYDGWGLISIHTSKDGANDAARKWIKANKWRGKENMDDDGLLFWDRSRRDESLNVEERDLESP
jgi:hypothetical protein